jgi:8-oxo-dGTP diphosphatase
VKQINVVGAVIVSEGRVLCTQRGGIGPLVGKWEFPGGKVEPGEAPIEALIREIREELDCDIDVGSLVTTTVYEYDFGVVTLTTYYCSVVDGRPQLTEHTAMRWLAPSELRMLDWAPADVPAVGLIEQHFATP